MFNILDICLIILFLMFIIVGFKRGVIKELFSFVGIVAVFILSYVLKGIVGKYLCAYLPFISFSGVLYKLTAINILMYQLIAFILVFAILLSIYAIILKISKFLQKIINMTIVLIIPSKLFGGLVSFLECYILVFIFSLILMIPLGNNSVFNESAIIDFILYKTPILTSYTKNIVEPINEIYDLGRKVSKNKLDINDANLETLNIMLKYEIVDKETVENLIKLHKLDDINNINSVLNKY